MNLFNLLALNVPGRQIHIIVKADRPTWMKYVRQKSVVYKCSIYFPVSKGFVDEDRKGVMFCYLRKIRHLR